MTDNRYEVVFRGDLSPGHHIDDVKQNLAALFKTDQSGVAHLFSGKLVIVKSDLDQEAANRYQEAMQGAGALVSIRPQKTPAAATSTAKEGELTLAPLGADMLPDRAKVKDQTHAIPTNHLSVAEVGSDVLNADEKKPFVEKEIDTSHLDVQ